MVFARKRFGQHFLHDPRIIEQIIAAVDARPGQALVEIGPGRGALTEALLAGAGALDAIEIDRDLVQQLCQRFGANPGFRLHEADALKFDFAALSAERGARLRVVGNLPYNNSTPLLFHLLQSPAAIAELQIMLQREVIERITAKPDTSEYGRLTVMLAPWVDAVKLFDVGPGAFRPPPKVWSAVARLSVRQQPRFAVDQRFARVVATAFSHRRKTLRNALKGLIDAATIERCGIDPSARPETLTPAQFGELAQTLANG